MQELNKNNILGAKLDYRPKESVAVKLKDGTILSLSDLPPENTVRWVASNKASVVRVFMAGLISKVELLERYGLSDEEFSIWLSRYIKGGKNALKVTKIRTR